MAKRFPQLPPLNTLLVFEAAGRHLNFSSAVAELGMIQPAVSHQVNFFEARLGISLVRRLHHGVVLTPAGAQLLDAVSQSPTTIHYATAAVRRRGGPKVLHVSTRLWICRMVADTLARALERARAGGRGAARDRSASARSAAGRGRCRSRVSKYTRNA